MYQFNLLNCSRGLYCFQSWDRVLIIDLSLEENVSFVWTFSSFAKGNKTCMSQFTLQTTAGVWTYDIHMFDVWKFQHLFYLVIKYKLRSYLFLLHLPSWGFCNLNAILSICGYTSSQEWSSMLWRLMLSFFGRNLEKRKPHRSCEEVWGFGGWEVWTLPFLPRGLDASQSPQGKMNSKLYQELFLWAFVSSSDPPHLPTLVNTSWTEPKTHTHSKSTTEGEIVRWSGLFMWEKYWWAFPKRFHRDEGCQIVLHKVGHKLHYQGFVLW